MNDLSMPMRRGSVVAAFVACLVAMGLAPAPAAAAGTLDMETHAAFFSAETRQPNPLDPQVFVRDAGAPAATGPQNIRHDAGLRPALIGDPASSALFNARAKPLGFKLGDWLGAKGSVAIGPKETTLTVKMQNLRPNGAYSLFENHFDQKPVGFTPLDGKGSTNSFTAKPDGTAEIQINVPARLTHDNAVLLVYHSDGKAHGRSRGDIGVTAHHQLIARIP